MYTVQAPDNNKKLNTTTFILIHICFNAHFVQNENIYQFIIGFIAGEKLW